MDAIASEHGLEGAWGNLVAQLAARIAQLGAHPARTVVLLPYSQLLPVARQAWAARSPDGFAPRFETTMNWASAHGFAPGPTDLTREMGRDLLTAQHWLARAGLAARSDALAARLVDAAWQLVPVVGAVMPAERAAWAARQQAALGPGLQAPQLQLEAALARIAIEWAAASAYPTDGLLMQPEAGSLDLLAVVQGLQDEPLHAALLARAGDRGMQLALPQADATGRVRLHAAQDAADEAERAAACVLRHVAEGRTPVALAATDRVLTRRVAALLASRGVVTVDQPGWKLSTTRGAARLMALLRACAWDASADDVLDGVKNIPAVAPALAAALERRVRRAGVRRWSSLRPADWGDAESVAQLAADVARWRDAMQGSRTVAQWLEALAQVLRETAQWPALESDAAGQQVIAALRLDEPADWAALPAAARRMPLHAFSAWLSDVLEAGQFVPAAPADAQVVILPLGQLPGRPFAALVVPGCDERSLPASPELPAPWTPAQRALLGLPSREALEALQRAAWAQALRVPEVDLLWRTGDGSGEFLLASPLVQALPLHGIGEPAAEPRGSRGIAPRPVARPLPVAPGLAVAPLSASAYEDLRRCPYRFFALRQLGLREADELDADVDKRDFGTWLHAVLRTFHETLPEALPPGERAAWIDRIAGEHLAALRVDEGEFLPFEAAWPLVRDGYLAWLDTHERGGARFDAAESEHRVELEGTPLLGRIDRIDRLAEGGALVMDYKTESLQVTRERVKRPLEDTQLAFYAVLLGDDAVQAAYLNISERGVVKDEKQPRLAEARAALAQAIPADMRRIAQGEPLPALGEGRVCELCAARGLCRKDDWS